MDDRARAWFEASTTHHDEWSLDRVLELKRDRRVSVVIPARNEERTVGEVVSLIRHDLMARASLVDELVVMDSLSEDSTARQAEAAGARVFSVAEVLPELGVRKGKGEALWKSLAVTTGDFLVFVDADLTEWGTHFVTALLGPMLADDAVGLSKGFYDRVADENGVASLQGGRVTELVARPFLACMWPELSAVAQPLAGEWAITRRLAEQLPFPVGYGVEFSTLLDTCRTQGLDAIAQVDLGRRAHRHQNLHDLGVMAAELMAVASRRLGIRMPGTAPVLPRLDHHRQWTEREVPTEERPPHASLTRG